MVSHPIERSILFMMNHIFLDKMSPRTLSIFLGSGALTFASTAHGRSVLAAIENENVDTI